MPENKSDKITETASAHRGSDTHANVAEPRRWFVAVVKNNTELQCQERLGKLGHEAYVPAQEWINVGASGRRRKATKMLLPAKLLMHVTESERKKIVNLPYILRYMTDRAKGVDKFGRHPLAVIPDEQIELLKFMLGQSEAEVTISPMEIRQGDKVRVVRGNLQGLEGIVYSDTDGHTKLQILIDYLGAASLEISPTDLEIIPHGSFI